MSEQIPNPIKTPREIVWQMGRIAQKLTDRAENDEKLLAATNSDSNELKVQYGYDDVHLEHIKKSDVGSTITRTSFSPGVGVRAEKIVHQGNGTKAVDTVGHFTTSPHEKPKNHLKGSISGGYEKKLKRGQTTHAAASIFSNLRGELAKREEAARGITHGEEQDKLDRLLKA